MTNKRSILSLILAVCLIIPAMFMLTACKNDKTPEETTTHTHTFSAAWESDATGHWHKATCEHTNEKSGFAAHTFGEWETVIAPGAGTAGQKERKCSVCDFKSTESVDALPLTTNNISVNNEEDLMNLIYNAKAQPISATADFEEGMEIKYKGTGDTTYDESTTAPTNAGTYEYTITIPAKGEWAKGEKTGTLEIKKYPINCPSELETRLVGDQTETNILGTIDISNIEDFESIGELTIIHTEKSFGVGRVGNVNKDKIECTNPNFELIKSGIIDLVVFDTSDELSLRLTTPVTTGSCYIGYINRGFVRKHDEIKVVGTNASGSIVMINATITEIEYLKSGEYTTTTAATKGEQVRITFNKDENSPNMTSFDYIVSARNIGTINEFQKSQSDEANFSEREVRAFAATIETTESIKLTISNSDSCTVKVFNAETGEEVVLSGTNTFQVESGTKIIIVIKQDGTKADHQVKIGTLELTM